MSGHELVNAAYCGNLDEVKQLIESRINPDDWTGNSMPAILAACMHGGNVEIVEYLIENKANPNNVTPDRLSALKTAAREANVKIVEMLLKAGADPNYEKDGEIALTVACDDRTDLKLLALLLPVSDKSYYQKAYEYSTTKEMRDMIVGAAPEIEFTNPSNGHGGPIHKMHLHYETTPTDPLLAQLYNLLNLSVSKDPNEQFYIVDYQMNLCDNPESFYSEGQLILNDRIVNILSEIFRDMEDDEPYYDIAKIILKK